MRHLVLAQALGEGSVRGLIETFIAVRDYVEGVIDVLQDLAYDESTYYEARECRPRRAAEAAPDL